MKRAALAFVASESFTVRALGCSGRWFGQYWEEPRLFSTGRTHHRRQAVWGRRLLDFGCRDVPLWAPRRDVPLAFRQEGRAGQRNSNLRRFVLSHSCRLASEQTFYQFAEKIDIDRFGYIRVEAGSFRSGAKVCFLVSGNGNDWDGAE